jgi:hypothetical protein
MAIDEKGIEGGGGRKKKFSFRERVVPERAEV